MIIKYASVQTRFQACDWFVQNIKLGQSKNVWDAELKAITYYIALSKN